MNVCVISGLGVVTSRAAMHIYVRGGGLVAKLCPTLATPWTVARQAPPRGILQGRTLEWVATAFSYVRILKRTAV